jgi:SAM-dependent methyltransferase
VPASPYGAGRRLQEGFPGLAREALEVYVAGAQERADEEARVAGVLQDLDALVDVGSLRDVLVVGCGPWPVTIEILRQNGLRAMGVEPVPAFVESACEYLRDEGAVAQGAAEDLPADDASCDVVFLESVLEHVDSPRLSLAEAHRVLRPGGVAFVLTTNRHSINLDKPEFNVPFYGWLPRSLKESYVFFHLHYRPSLANFTERPAVHWFSYPDLCALGRDAGFGQFYSHLDLRRDEARPTDPRGRLRFALLRAVQRSPLLRTLALTQRGGEIFMLKRRADGLSS